jgi:hypothetical protein
VTPRWIAIAHRLPERTRLRSPVLRSDPPACERLADALAHVAGVRQVAIRPYTGSILIEHDARVAVDTLVAEAQRVLSATTVLQRGDAPPVDGDVPAFSSLARKVAHACLEIDRDLRRSTDGVVDLGTLAALGFAGAGAMEIAASGKLPLPPWFNLAWWAFRTFVTTEKEEIEAECNGHGTAITY